jgi:hypothetical protein
MVEQEIVKYHPVTLRPIDIHTNKRINFQPSKSALSNTRILHLNFLTCAHS